jgi:hypothetical protein
MLKNYFINPVNIQSSLKVIIYATCISLMFETSMTKTLGTELKRCYRGNEACVQDLQLHSHKHAE